MYNIQFTKYMINANKTFLSNFLVESNSVTSFLNFQKYKQAINDY